MNRNNIERAIALAELVNGNVYIKADLYMALRRLSKRLKAIDIHYCNGTKYNTEDVYNDAIYKVYASLNTLLADTGLAYYHQSDPRGASLYVGKGEIDSNNYTNHIAIY